MTQHSVATSRFIGPLLALVIPALVLLALELTCRVFDLDSRIAKRTSPSTPQVLEMPTWMLREDNAVARASVRASLDPEALQWMNLFQEGNGYRVRLLPLIDTSVLNTFSRIPRELQERYRIQSNSLGFRGPELSENKATGTFRILVFGDSSSFGWGVNQDQMYSELLAQQLTPGSLATQSDKTFSAVEVGNFAIPGDSSEYGSLIFDQFASHYHPDLVILGFGANDAKKVVTSHTAQVSSFKESANSSAIRKILQRSAFVRVLTHLLAPKPTAVPNQLVTAVERKRYRSNLVRMGESAKAAGAQTLLLSLCTPAQYRRSAAAIAKRKGFLQLDGQELLLESLPKIQSAEIYATKAQALRKDLGTLLSQEPLLYVSSDGCHPNAIGHEIIAQGLLEVIRSTSWNGPLS